MTLNLNNSQKNSLSQGVKGYFRPTGRIKFLEFHKSENKLNYRDKETGTTKTFTINSKNNWFDGVWEMMKHYLISDVFELEESNEELEKLFLYSKSTYRFLYEGTDEVKKIDSNELGYPTYAGDQITLESVKQKKIPNFLDTHGRQSFKIRAFLQRKLFTAEFSYVEAHTFEDAFELSVIRWGELQIWKKGMRIKQDIFGESFMKQYGILGLRYKDDNQGKRLELDRFDGNNDLHRVYQLDENDLERSMNAQVGQAIRDLKDYYGVKGNGFENIVESGNAYRNIFKPKDTDEVIEQTKDSVETIGSFEERMQQELHEWKKNRNV